MPSLDDGFLEAFIHRPHRVLGHDLRPFSLAHICVLEAIRSPLPEVLATAGPIELLVAARVCSCGAWSEFSAVLGPTSVEADAKLLAAFDSPEGLDEVRGAFAAYFADFSPRPFTWRRIGSDASTAPWPLAFVTAVAAGMRMDPERVWFLPHCEVRWYEATLGANEGRTQFVTGREKAVMERWRAEGITRTENSGYQPDAHQFHRKLNIPPGWGGT